MSTESAIFPQFSLLLMNGKWNIIVPTQLYALAVAVCNEEIIL
jgi:hypothetical protein